MPESDESRLENMLPCDGYIGVQAAGVRCTSLIIKNQPGAKHMTSMKRIILGDSAKKLEPKTEVGYSAKKPSTFKVRYLLTDCSSSWAYGFERIQLANSFKEIDLTRFKDVVNRRLRKLVSRIPTRAPPPHFTN